MVKSKRDLNLKVERQRNIKQFDQTIILCEVIKINKMKSISIVKIKRGIS